MKRIVVFVVAGPLIGLLIALLLIGVVSSPPAFNALPALTGIAYLIGGLPALLTALVDWRASGLSPIKRALISAAVGFGLSAAIPWVVNPEFSYFLVVGLIGAIAAAVCSLLASWLLGEQQ